MIDKKTYRLLHRSRNSREVAANSRAEAKVREDIKQIGDHVAEVGKTGDARLILETELALLQEERNYLSNSKTQIGSLDTAILSDEEKELIDIRRANIRKADKMYVAMQQQTLGITPPRQDRDLSL